MDADSDFAAGLVRCSLRTLLRCQLVRIHCSSIAATLCHRTALEPQSRGHHTVAEAVAEAEAEAEAVAVAVSRRTVSRVSRLAVACLTHDWIFDWPSRPVVGRSPAKSAKSRDYKQRCIRAP
jgi:hypothetical protein